MVAQPSDKGRWVPRGLRKPPSTADSDGFAISIFIAVKTTIAVITATNDNADVMY